jgi:hypothetical protein
MTCSCRVIAWLLLITLTSVEISFAQRPAGKSKSVRASQTAGVAEEQQYQLTTRVYRILDLVLPTPTYAFQSTVLPTLSERGSVSELGQLPAASAAFAVGMGGMMGSGEGYSGESGYGIGGEVGAMTGGGMAGMAMPGMGMGGLGMGMPGTMAAPTKTPPGVVLAGGMHVTVPGLIQAIQMFVDPPSWSTVGGNATLAALGGSLVVSQTPANHAQLEDFLAKLRSDNSSSQTVTVEARWLSLDSQQVRELIDGGNLGGPFPAEVERYRGRLTCFNGQTVHIVSGRLQTVMQGAIPVVGDTQAAYQPQLLKPHIGAMLQVTPTLLPDGAGAIVDVRSIVTRADPPPQSVGLYDSQAIAAITETSPERVLPTVQVDRLNIATQQLATTLRVALNRPTLVGGLTFPAIEGEVETGNRQLYLVIAIVP